MASAMVFPLIISVAMEEVAMAEPQPKVLNFTSVITSPSIFRYIFMMSPHLGLPTWPTPSAFAISPTLRGCSKWSITLSEYSIAVSPFQLQLPGGLLCVPVPYGGQLPEIRHHLGHFLQNVVHVRLGILRAQGEPQGAVGNGVGQADGQ